MLREYAIGTGKRTRRRTGISDQRNLVDWWDENVRPAGQGKNLLHGPSYRKAMGERGR
jgi:hypothetical protein